MSERKVIHKGNIGNALHSVAPDHITTTADEIFDEERQEYQQDINEGVGRFIDNPEFIRVEIDSDKRIIRAIKADGTEYLGAGIEVHGNINTDGAVTTILDNPEFSKVHLDNDGRILYGVQRDGNFYFGCGVPQQIVYYIRKKIEELSLDEYEDIVDFLGELITGDKTLQELLNKKVDKEEGKSLIDEDYASGVSYIENHEFVNVELDNDGKIVKAIRKDGTEVLGAGLEVGGDVDLKEKLVITSVYSPEFVYVKVDTQNKIIFAINADGTVYFGAGVPPQVVKYVVGKIEEVTADITSISERVTAIETFLEGFKYVENPEFVNVLIDSENKILEEIKTDGTKVINMPLEIQGVRQETIYNSEFVQIIKDSKERIIEATKKNGKKVFYGGIEGVASKEDVDNLDLRVTALENEENNGYWWKKDSELTSRIVQLSRRLNDINPNGGTGSEAYKTHPKILSLLHFSDLHDDTIRLEHIMGFYNKFSDYIDDVVCSGDFNDLFTIDFSYRHTLGADDVLMCMGNHEHAYRENGPENIPANGAVHHDVPMTDLYDKYYKDVIQDWGVTYQVGKTWWYKDYSNGIRLIAVDPMIKDASVSDYNEQITWLNNLLSDSITNNKHVILMQHFPVNSMRKVECNFSDTNPNEFSTDIVDFLEAIQTFKNNGGNFICHIAGHLHMDWIGYPNNYADQLVVICNCATMECAYSDQARVENTRSEDCFNLISFDITTNNIKILRVGANVDYLLRDRNVLCINYKTKQIIYQS